MGTWINVPVGQQATCSVCSEPIMMRAGYGRTEDESVPEFARERDGWSAKHSSVGWAVAYDYVQQAWEHVNDHTRRCAREGGMHIRPKEFCSTETQSNYKICGKKVPLENFHAEVYACGIHCKKIYERMAADEAANRARERREQQALEDAWAFDVQKAAWEKLKDTPLQEALTAVNAFENDRWGKSWKKRDCMFDPQHLLELLEDHYVLKEQDVTSDG